MVEDTSALLAILSDEPERRGFNEAIETADCCRLSTATFVEASIVVDARYGAEGLRAFDRLIEIAGVEIVPVDLPQARAARDAWQRFGKGRHAAAPQPRAELPPHLAAHADGGGARRPRHWTPPAG